MVYRNRGTEPVVPRVFTASIIVLLAAVSFPAQAGANDSFSLRPTIDRAAYGSDDILSADDISAPLEEPAQSALETSFIIVNTIGHDSNVDGEPLGRSSAIQRHEFQAEVSYDQGGYFLDFEAGFAYEGSLRYSDLDERSNSIAAKAGIDLEDDLRLAIGILREDEREESDGALHESAYIEAVSEDKNVEMILKGGIAYDTYKDELDAFDQPFENELNFAKVFAEVAIRGGEDVTLSPYFKALISQTDFTNTGELDRDATHYVISAGVSFSPAEDLRLDVGGRFNAWDHNGPQLRTYSNGFLDARLVWNLRDNLEIVAAVERSLNEPDDSDSYFLDETSYSAGIVWKPTSLLELDLALSVIKEKSAYTLARSTEFKIDSTTYYRLHKNARLLLSASFLHEQALDEDKIASEYDQFVVLSGVELTF